MHRIVQQRVAVTLPNSSVDWNPPFEIVFPFDMDIGLTPLTHGSFVGTCNDTHRTLYYDASKAGFHEHARQHASDPPHVVRVRVWHGGPASLPPPRRHRDDVLLFQTIEPPVGFPFASLSGYDGELSYRMDAAAWRPLPHWRLDRVIAAARTLPYEPSKRDSIGIWFDNCLSALRTPLVDALLETGLNVQSRGNCRRNRPDVGRLRDNLPICATHRLILAAQHTACQDYINTNLETALRCGAIPIIARVAGVPDYEALLGRFPHIDASMPGWLDRVRRIMVDDEYYRKVLQMTTGRRELHSQHTRAANLLRTNGRAFHCQFHDIRRRRPSGMLEWPRCLICNGSRFHESGADGGVRENPWHEHVQCSTGASATAGPAPGGGAGPAYGIRIGNKARRRTSHA
jgi:hypothetical protein